MQAMSLLKKNDIEFNLTLVGDTQDKQLTKIKEVIKKNDLSKEIKLTGEVNNETIVNLLDEADVFIVPALVDFSPRSTWEAAARGLPIIMSKGVRIQLRSFF